MSIVITNGSTTLATASGFYRVEAYNLGSDSTTALALSSVRTIAVTFANAGNCQGVVLSIHSVSPVINRSVLVKLQENTGSWVDRASVTLTYDQIMGTFTGTGVSGYHYGQAYVPFTFSAPYAVDTTAAKWRISVQQSGGTTGNWYVLTSDATNPFYATWCDNAVTFADNDTLIVKDACVIDSSATLASVLGTGSTTYGICAVVCRNTDYSKANVALLQWENPPVSSYTLTVKGSIMLGHHSGVRIGTEASPIPYAQLADVYFAQPNVGSTTTSGIRSPLGGSSASTTEACNSVFMYGEIPATVKTTLASNAAISQAHVITTDDVSAAWSANDYVVIGKQDTASQGSVILHQVASISGTDITLTANLATAARLAGGSVVRFNGYGVRVRGYSNAVYGEVGVRSPSNFIFSGVEFINARIYPIANSYYYTMDDATYRSQHLVQDCSARFDSTSLGYLVYSPMIPKLGMLINRVNTFRGAIVTAPAGYANSSMKSGYIEVINCICLSNYSTVNFAPGTATKLNAHHNRFENGYRYGGSIAGLGCIFTDNYFWGQASAYGSLYYALGINQLVNPISIARNTYNKNGCALLFNGAPSISAVDIESVFGDEAANTVDVGFSAGALIDYEMQSPTGIATLGVDYLPDTVVGSRFRITDFDGTAKDDRNWLTNGYIIRTGDGLTDTTVRTSGTGKYAMRFEPGADVLEWTQAVPTGNIQARTMAVTVWVKINAAAYYSSTYTLPTLTITYDGSTAATDEAAAITDWQQLAVVFTPTTALGKIDVKVSGLSDQSGSDAYFYVDDMNVAYPAGHVVDLGGLDLWSSGLPITPAIATFPALGGVWDEAISSHTVAGSFADHVLKLLTLAKFLGNK